MISPADGILYLDVLATLGIIVKLFQLWKEGKLGKRPRLSE